MTAQSNAPVIIRRKKVVSGEAHHGGAWKVAYADFVTAMMAFFLLMWLLGATNEKQRKGIADFFNPTIPVNRVSGGGDGAFGGDSVFSEMTLAQNGTGAGMMRATAQRQARGDTGVQTSENGRTAESESAAFDDIAERLSGAGGESAVSELLSRHIVTRLTDEGLIVELYDLPGATLFHPGRDEPTRLLGELMSAVGEAFGLVDNDIAIQGHVSALPIVLREKPVWRSSTTRADHARRKLEQAGIAGARVQRVTGFGDRKPAMRMPMAVQNNRLELILLRDLL